MTTTATTISIETLTDEERECLACEWVDAGDEGLDEASRAKALRIIDAHAAERAALTEQVAQLTETVGMRDRRVCALENDQRRLTEALAAAEHLAQSRLKSFEEAYASVRHLQATVVDKEIAYDMACQRAATAERDRDAVMAELRASEQRWLRAERDGMATEAFLKNIVRHRPEYQGALDAHLSGQPAAPARTLCPRCGWVSARERTGDDDTWARCKCWEQEGPSHLKHHAAPAPTEEVFEVQGRSWPAGTHPAPTATSARVQEWPEWRASVSACELARREAAK